jgi:hypothetical protein
MENMSVGHSSALQKRNFADVALGFIGAYHLEVTPTCQEDGGLNGTACQILSAHARAHAADADGRFGTQGIFLRIAQDATYDPLHIIEHPTGRGH